MYKKGVLFLLCIFIHSVLLSQQNTRTTIQVIDHITKKAIPNAHVRINNIHMVTNKNGYCVFKHKHSKNCYLKVSHLGYKTFYKVVQLKDSLKKVIPLVEAASKLSTVIINHKKRPLKLSATKLKIDKAFLYQNRENSLMQSLEKIPGVGTLTIGANQSKPSIRGLGFNRVVVLENGIKHEAQQWGVDHGLEIDQYNIDNIEITKGAASLFNGSDAIGGVISLRNNLAPLKHTFKGSLNINYKTNNNLIGISASAKQRYEKWFYKTSITHERFGDYKVPTNKITYDNYIFELHKNQLRNTAGYNHNISFSLGYVSDNIFSSTTFSNVTFKNGFFANAHGLEVRTSRIDYDKSSYDIDLPYHKVNHFKITNNTSFFSTKNNNKTVLELGYQKNHREEHSEPVPHGYMPKPSSSKERVFNKHTYTFNIKQHYNQLKNHNLIFGLNSEYQNNTIGGWGFLIPSFKRFTIGAFVYDQYKITNKLYFDAGLRYDYGSINTSPYFEWFYSPVTHANGSITQKKIQRSNKNNLSFNSFTASAGVNYTDKNISYTLNLGKSFRIPLANELASDGVNYHMYRYEEGNINLSPEISYQLNSEFVYEFKKLNFQITPFINYFDNYIYLTPTAEYYKTLQKYKYTQNKVLRLGGELSLHYKPSKNFSITGTLEYVKAKQLNGNKKNFTLPFSPPLTSIISLEYYFKPWLGLTKTKIFSDLRLTTRQNEIVPPEKPTQGYSLVNLGLSSNINLFSAKNPLSFQVKANNLFDKKVFNHTSFYRLIEVPEPGRNYSITIIQTF